MERKTKNKKNITYIFNPFKNYFTPHVQCVPSHPPCWLSHHAGTCLDTHHITRSIFVVKRWHYIRGKVKVHTSLSVGHRTVVGLDCGTRSTKRLLVCARVRGRMQRNLGAIGKSGTQIKAGLWYRQVPLLILSHISIQVFQLASLDSLLEFLSLWCMCVRFVFLSVFFQVLRALVHLVLWWLWLCIYMPECLPLDVRYSVCTSVSETAPTAPWCETDYRKALGFARGSFWFL